MIKSLSKKSYVLTFTLSVFLIHSLFIFAKVTPTTSKSSSDSLSIESVNTVAIGVKPTSTTTVSVYEKLDLKKLGLSQQAFEYAMKGYKTLLSSGKLNNDKILTIVDFSMPSSKKRLFVIDLNSSKILYHTYVSHGRNSGREVAANFSNQPESFMSSPGFYTTMGTYIGKHGYSLRLNGEEKGINDNALSRAIVMHSAAYVDESLIRSQGYIGRSLGCPAVPEKLHKGIIDNIKNGSCLFIYSPAKSYVSNSRMIKQTV
jgi:hypothetical protein